MHSIHANTPISFLDTEKNQGAEGVNEGRGSISTSSRVQVGAPNHRPRRSAFLLFYSLILFTSATPFISPFPSLPPFLMPFPSGFPRNGFSEKRKARRFPLGMARYEIVRRCSHRRETSVGYWGRDYPTCTRENAHVRVRVSPSTTTATVAPVPGKFVYRPRSILANFRNL